MRKSRLLWIGYAIGSVLFLSAGIFFFPAAATEKPVKESTGLAGKKIAEKKSIILSNGVYVPYTFGNKIVISATMLSNPSRLDTVSLGFLYSPASIQLTNADVEVNFYKALSNGQVSAAFPDGLGTIKVGLQLDSKMDLLQRDVVECQMASASENITDHCATIYSRYLGWLRSSDAKIISSVPGVVPGKPEGKLINWDANVAFMPSVTPTKNPKSANVKDSKGG